MTADIVESILQALVRYHHQCGITCDLSFFVFDEKEGPAEHFQGEIVPNFLKTAFKDAMCHNWIINIRTLICGLLAEHSLGRRWHVSQAGIFSRHETIYIVS